MKILAVELGKSIIALFMFLISCKENKLIHEKDGTDKLSVEILSVEKKIHYIILRFQLITIMMINL
jgi:Zn-finger protein